MDTHNAIVIQNVYKTFRFAKKDAARGFWSNIFRPMYKEVHAVDNISLTVKRGEKIAFIGPNGAGKSTTIKMLTGILFPSSGKLEVLGLSPQDDRKKLAYKIGTVFGQRSQLFPNLPISDSLEFFGVMYDMDRLQTQERIKELSRMFDLSDFIDQPVRKLSLGQRMRGEIAAALVHRPEIIFLDEPTIGLDIVAKKSLRELLEKINKEEGVTIFLTSHDVGDIEALCERTIIINSGKVVVDMPTSELTKTFNHEKYVDVTLESGEVKKHIIDTNRETVGNAVKRILGQGEVVDVDVYDVPLEAVIREVYEKNKNV